MLNISHIFNIRYSVSRIFTFYPLFISVFLYYHAELFGLFVKLTPVASYVVAFSLFFLLIFYKNHSLSLNKWFYIGLIFLLLPFSLGIFNNWMTQDIMADFARYFAPFLGFTSALVLFRRAEIKDLITFFYFIGFIHLCFYYVSVFSKIISVLDGGSIVEYSKNGLDVHNLPFLLFFFSFKKKIFNRFTYLLLAGYIIGFIINPIIVMSKARMISMIFLFILIFLFYLNNKQRKYFSILLLILSSFAFNFIDYQHTFSRFSNAYESYITDDYSKDASTSFRLAEIENITQTLLEKPIERFPLGLGLGALYYDTYKPLKGGVSQENFRPDGGVHHIFTVYFAYVFRYGLIGLFIYLIWLYTTYSKISSCKNED